MSKYTYTGPTKQIGRFGTLKRGDNVEFTMKEERTIQDDKHPHFRKFDAKAKIEPVPFDLPDGFDDLSDAEQAKVLAKLKASEEGRKAEVTKANDQTANNELRELTKAELLNYVEQMNLERKGANQEPLTIPKGASRKEIIGLIRQAKGEQSHEGDDADDKE